MAPILPCLIGEGNEAVRRLMDAMEAYFVLDEHGEPRLEPDREAWARWYEQADRTVARTAIGPGIMVLTTFRGVDENPDASAGPMLFGTRVFGGVFDGSEVGDRNREEAIATHAEIAHWCRAGAEPDYGITDEMLQ